MRTSLKECLKERIIVITFSIYNTVITDDENLLKSDPNVYKLKDKTLKDKFNTTKCNVKMLFDNYAKYEKEALKPPASVKEYTHSYF